MENRNAQHHRERLADSMREEIIAIIEGELTDPRIGLATVTEVQIMPDGRLAHVMIAVQDDDIESTLEGLESARGYIRREIGFRLRLRNTPDILFIPDHSQEIHTRVDQLLTRLQKRQKK